MGDRVKIVERSIDAFNRRDLDAMLQDARPDVELFPGAANPIQFTAYLGREGVGRYLAVLAESFEDVQLDLLEVRDLGDSALALARVSASPRDSREPLEQPLGLVYHFAAGRVSCVHAYPDHEEASRAAGLAD